MFSSINNKVLKYTFPLRVQVGGQLTSCFQGRTQLLVVN